MEHHLLHSLLPNLAAGTDRRLRMASLSAAHFIICNPHTTVATRQTLAQTLAQALAQTHADDDTAFIRAALKILVAAAADVPSVAILHSGTSLAADAVASLENSVFNEGLVLSLVLSPNLAVRSRVLELLVSRVRDVGVGSEVPGMFLGLAGDIYPSVRRQALEGLIVVVKAGGDLVLEKCYDRAVRLVKDEDLDVQLAAVRLMSECGKVFAKEAVDVSERMDRIFVQLSSVARDMHMKVRLEAFNAIGEVKHVSEDVLLQSLSKKPLGKKNGKDILDVCKKVDRFSLSAAAGVFVHGIEDEYYEVRSSACNSLGKLSVLSTQFASNALNLLMDMLNDDAEVVRLQTLQTLCQMTTYDSLAMQDKFLHMFFGLLADISPLIRSAARKVIQQMKLSNITMFKSTIDYLIGNLEAYPEEEEEILFVLASIGMNHKKLCAKYAMEFASEIVSSSKGELNLDSSTVAAKMVLSVSSSVSKDQCMLGLSERLKKLVVPPKRLLYHHKLNA